MHERDNSGSHRENKLSLDGLESIQGLDCCQDGGNISITPESLRQALLKGKIERGKVRECMCVCMDGGVC